MSLISAINHDQMKYEKEVKSNEIHLAKNGTKMLLPNDKKCFTSFHGNGGKLFEHQDHLKEDCSRSFDMLTFKRRNVINLNHNLITLNNSLFINDTLNDSLQWCLEPGYQNGPKNLFDNELNNDLYANSSFDSKADEHCGQASLNNSSTPYNYHSNQNYELLSKRLDANLAEMDIETFNNYSNLLNDINTKFSSTEEVIDGANEQLINNCSVDDSLISELNERSNTLRYQIENGSRLKPALNSSFTLNSNQTCDNDDDTTQLYESALDNGTTNDVNLESVGISVDSLDNSCFEQKCAEVMNKCKKTDKTKYTLVFDGQIDDSTIESWLNYERHSTQRDRSKEIRLNKIFNDLNRRLMSGRTTDKLSKSEYSTNSTLEDDEQNNSIKNRSSHNDDLNMSKMTKSLQNDMIDRNLRQQFDQDDYMPIFNLNNSLNSESSSVSAPKSLIKLFIQNKNSPSSSGGVQSGESLDESRELTLSKTSKPINENEDKKCEKATNTKYQKTGRAIEIQTTDSMNQNINQLNSTETHHLGGMLCGGYRTVLPDNSLTAASSTVNTNLKIYHNRKTSPIREEDEQESSTREVKKYTSFQNVTATSRNRQNRLDASLQTNDDHEAKQSNCPRSISMNDFNSKAQNLIKQYTLKTSQINDQQQQPQQQQQYSSRPTMCRTNRNSKECSISSGYLSSGGLNNMFAENNRKQFQQRMLNPQQMTNCEDKQVQTSIYEHSSAQQTPILINELPNAKNCCSSSNNTPIYVYYPNYSLPDLNFVQMGSFQNIHLSPTKFQPTLFDFNGHSTIKRRGSSAVCSRMNSRAKTRPKSTGDFEKLTKESLNHIQDWESLKTLLPDDIKELIETLNLDEESEFRMKSKTTSNTPTSNKTFQMSMQNSATTIKLRPKVMNRGNLNDKNHTNQYTSSNNQLNDQNNKRLSLQEPMHLDDCMLNCSSTNTHSCTSCCSDHQTRRGMIKSATMNMPIIMQQQHRQMQSRMLCQTPCHSCCSMNQLNMCHQQTTMPMGSCHCIASNGHCGFNNNTFNQFSGNHQMMNTCCTSNYSKTLDQQYYYQQQSKITSPMKPCNPISEQNEEYDFETLNRLLENENEDGELDFDRLLNCHVGKVNRVNSGKKGKIVRKKLSDFSKESRNSKENFNDLKNHWEKVTSSASSKQTTPTTPTTRKPLVINQTPSQSTKIQNQKDQQPSQIKPRPIVSRYPRSQVKAKVNSRRSRSKSPEKSNKEVIILTKKTVKPQVPLKPVKANNSNTITRTSKQSQSTKKPVRPSSFNTQFKSMIPVARNINRSPPTK